MACGFLFEFPDKLIRAILNNWLVNPSGLPGRWHELDLLQEHINFWIKRVFPDQNTDFDSSFLRHAVSLNIKSFGNIREGLSGIFGLFSGGSSRQKQQVDADLNVLGSHYLQEQLHVFVAGRRQAFSARDAFADGLKKLSVSQLATFLARSEGE